MNTQPVHAVGIDISDGSLELVDLGHSAATSVFVQQRNRVLLSENAIVHGLITDEEILSKSLRELLSISKLSPDSVAAVIALPDSQVIVQMIPLDSMIMPAHRECEMLASEAARSLSASIARPIAQWELKKNRNGTFDLCVFITSKLYVRQWSTFFRKHSIALSVVEMESLSLARALLHTISHDDSVGIIDFGFRTTSLSIHAANGLLYSHALDSGGYHLSGAVAGNAQWTWQEAEAYKDLHGLQSESNTVYKILRSKIEQLFSELNIYDVIDNWHPSRLVLTGGGANMPGLREFCQNTFKLPIHLSHLWFIDPHHTKGIAQVMSPRDQNIYAAATGLALRGLDQQSFSRGINFV